MNFNFNSITTQLVGVSIPVNPFIASGDLVLSGGVITSSYVYDSSIDVLEDNPKPYATNLSITNDGLGRVGDTFTCNYTFVSPSGYPESGTTFQWIRLNERGEFVENIVGATLQDHDGVVGDEGYRLGCIVTVSQTATAPANGNPTGIPVQVETEEVVLELDVVEPTISNFEIRAGLHNRIYFESSEVITASTFASFTVASPSKTITAITINAGQLTDHYLTVSTDFAEGDSPTLASSGGDIEDGAGNSMASFTATAITNNVDTTAPVITWSPLDAETGIDVTGNITITFNEPIRNTDGSEITNANVAAIITALKETDAIGADIGFDATINIGKTVITIDPTSSLPENGDVYVAIAAVEDNVGNETSGDNITFTTGGAAVRTLLRTSKVSCGNNSIVAVSGYNLMNGTDDDNGDSIALNEDDGSTSTGWTLTNLGDWSGNNTGDTANAGAGDIQADVIRSLHQIGANSPNAVGKQLSGLDDTKSYVISVTSVAKTSDTTNYNIEFKINDIDGDKTPVNIDAVAQKASPSVVQIATNIHSDGGVVTLYVYEPAAFQAILNSMIIDEYNIDE